MDGNGNCRLGNSGNFNRGFTGPTGPAGGGEGGSAILKFSGNIEQPSETTTNVYLTDSVGYAATTGGVAPVYAQTAPISYPAMVTGTATDFSAYLAPGSLDTNQTATVQFYVNSTNVVAAQLVFAVGDAGTTKTATFSQAIVPTDLINVRVTLTAPVETPEPAVVSAALRFNF